MQGRHFKLSMGIQYFNQVNIILNKSTYWYIKDIHIGNL